MRGDSSGSWHTGRVCSPAKRRAAGASLAVRVGMRRLGGGGDLRASGDAKYALHPESATSTPPEPGAYTPGMDILEFPGGDLVQQGLADLAADRATAASLLVLIGAPRLRAAGVAVPFREVPQVEHRLYELLASGDPDGAHSQYNALVRRLVSFERALECVR